MDGSRLFTPGAGIYSPLLDKTLAENDIKYINTERFRYNPLGNGKYNREFIYNGKKSKRGIILQEMVHLNQQVKTVKRKSTNV